jgi:hypothetical protein
LKEAETSALQSSRDLLNQTHQTPQKKALLYKEAGPMHNQASISQSNAQDPIQTCLAQSQKFLIHKKDAPKTGNQEISLSKRP